MNVKIADQSFESISNPDGTLTFKRYDEESKFWVKITATQSKSSNENEKKALNILKKNYIERNCKQ
ncbi:MAG: hypothetical protein K8R73_08310 [Clostridiales bacterium]|nr:hypothetical protein [Clostridiales bacterium]